MARVSQREAARRLEVNAVTIGEWCDPRDGLVRLADHPWIAPDELEELEWVASRRKAGVSLQQLRLALERRRTQEDMATMLIRCEEIGVPETAYLPVHTALRILSQPGTERRVIAPRGNVPPRSTMLDGLGCALRPGSPGSR